MHTLRAASRATPRRRAASAWAWSDGLEPRLLEDIYALTGVGRGVDVATLPPSRNTAFHLLRLDAKMERRLRPEVVAMWRMVCAGGCEATRRDLLAAQAQPREETFVYADDVSTAHVCDVSVEDLRPISLAELEVDMVHVGRVLWVTLAADAAFTTSSVVAVVDDDEDESTTLYLYNAVRHDSSPAEIAAKFPRGLRLAIKEPYYRVVDCNRSLRVDNPGNVMRPNADEARTDSAIATIDSATVVGPVDIVLTEGRMRGLVTTRAVSEGEVLFQERALASLDTPSEKKFLIASDGRQWDGGKVDFLAAIISGLADDALLRAKMAFLYDGTLRSDVPDVSLFAAGAASPQGVPQVSAARVARVMDLNSYSGQGCYGAIFGLSSFLNHAPNDEVNTSRRVRDGTMSVVARYDLDAEEELTTSYFDDDGSADAAAKREHFGIPEPAMTPVRDEPFVLFADQLFTSRPASKASPPASTAKKKKR
ncbi:hypothetical protein M885DRAFT_539624 [Pelagophyceae sp. CCMP2097]|nr:hypothetical protein M885DRAFT_539624 [Pelagophyceae sp. CCMP2097]